MKRIITILLAALFLILSVPVFAAETENATEHGTDLLLVCAHPGDEVTYFSGLLSSYAGEKRYDCTVVFLSCESEELRKAAVNNLRKLGVENEPEFASFSGDYFDSADSATKKINKNQLAEYLTALIRRIKPLVVVTHGIDGEYGHGLHALASQQMEQAVQYSGNKKKLESSAKKYGTWDVERLYLHDTLGEKVIPIDQNAPLEAFGGMSALAVDTSLYNATYAKTAVVALPITAEGYTKADYRLDYQKDGLTDPVDDLFDGIGEAVPSAEKKTLKVEAVPEPEKQPDGHYFEKDETVETVIADEEKGHWEYHSSTLSIVIDRCYSENGRKQPICYHKADVKMNGENAYFSGLRETKNEMPWYMCRRNRAVLGLTGDNMNVDESEIKGVIIRNGIVYNDRAAADTLAFMPDMTLEIFDKGSVNAQDLLNMGITDTYSFGPALIKDGKTGSNLNRKGVGVLNPRGGIGMIEPGHFLLIAVDGRQKGYSYGLSLDSFAHLFYINGCTEAYNLDGGSSLSMVFMGEMLNKHGTVKSDFQRKLPDMLLFGHSEKVPSVDDPVLNNGFGRKEAAN